MFFCTTPDGPMHRQDQFHENRSSIFKRVVATGLVDYAAGKLSRTETWVAKTQYSFSISPWGNGLDTHRTWEDLALGEMNMLYWSAVYVSRRRIYSLILVYVVRIFLFVYFSLLTFYCWFFIVYFRLHRDCQKQFAGLPLWRFESCDSKRLG